MPSADLFGHDAAQPHPTFLERDAIWRDQRAGLISLAEAQRRSAAVGNQPAPAPDTPAAPPRRSRAGSRPISAASMARRRRWVAFGRMPGEIAAEFTLGEQAALAVVADVIAQKGEGAACTLAVGHIAAVAGISATTVRNALRRAVRLGLITVTLRPLTRWRNDTNLIRIVSAEWLTWLRLSWRRFDVRDSGCNFAKGTNTILKKKGLLALKMAWERRGGSHPRSGPPARGNALDWRRKAL